MKNIIVLLIATLATTSIAEPIRLDVEVHLDADDKPAPTKLGPVVEATHHAKGQRQRLSQAKVTPVVHSPYRTKVEATPVVDLGYERHQASLGKDGTYWNFANVPYAQPPVSSLRFAAAQPLPTDSPSNPPPLNTGEEYKICPQQQVGWVAKAGEFLEDYFKLDGDLSAWTEEITPKQYGQRPDIDYKKQSEDCLTLDVMVPKRVFNEREEYLVPVVVWFFGGGYIFGDKNLFGTPEGLFNASSFMNPDDTPDEDIIYVTFNYRLGAFGWLAGDSFEKSSGFENAGLSDQRMALEWVQKNIQKFGGDPGRVTVMGESAGASSILHHLVSYGHRYSKLAPPPFKRAILQSPAFFPQGERTSMEKTYQSFLSKVGAANLEELRAKDPHDLIEANADLTWESPWGQFTFGPVVDDSLVLTLPSLLLRAGFFASSVDIMVGYNTREGLLFTPPWVRTREAFKENVLKTYPKFWNDSLDDLVNKHYPIFALTPPETKVSQVAAAYGDLAVNCNARYLTTAWSSARRNTYNYKFNVPPGIHGQDGAYTYWPVEKPPPLEVKVKQAQALQRYITSFIKFGDPNYGAENDVDFPPYYFEGDGAVMQFGGLDAALKYVDEYKMVDDTVHKELCDNFWQIAPYWDPEAEGMLTDKLRVQGGRQSALEL